jgi:two-component system sensor histidine kinase AgrC
VLKENVKVSKSKLVLTLLLVALLATIDNMYLIGIVKTLIALIIHMFEFKYLFKIEYQKSTLLTIIYIILLIISEMLVLFPITQVSNLSKIYFYNEIAGNFIGNLLVCIVFIALTCILKKSLRKVIDYKIENNVKIIIFSILMLLCILIVFYNAFENITLNFNLIVSIFIMLIFVMILISLIRQTFANNELTKKYEQTLEFMTTYEDEVEKQRVLRHETKNAFLTIKAQITDKAKEKDIIEYIDNILQDDVKMKNEEYAKFKYLPANGIKGLCYFKAQEAENKGVKVSINISARIKNSGLTKLSIKERKELGKILGVFLDNAIEASTESKEKILGIEAYLISNNVKIIISNSYSNKIDTNKIGKEKYSTKGKKHGHGLLLVRSIVNSNNKFETTTEITEKLYIQNIVIKEPTNN